MSRPPVSTHDLVRPQSVSKHAILRALRVPPECAGQRLDVFLQSQLRNTSRTRACEIIKASAYCPGGRRLKPSDRVQAEQRVVLWRPPFEEPDRLQPLHALYEDEHLLALDKPALLAVHPTARHHNATVIKQLSAQRPGEFVSLIHRLDRETSGILLVARSSEAERAFKALFEHRSLQASRNGATTGSVHKTYLAITWGVPDVGVVDVPLERDSDNRLRVKMRVARKGQGQPAKTAVSVLDVRSGYALVALWLHTGRQHQIRVHLAHLGCPVVGDKLYGPDDGLLARAADGELTEQDRASLELPRHALHAARYRLPHALTGEPLDLVADLPADLSEFWDSKRPENG